jgi:hypothetical protein
VGTVEPTPADTIEPMERVALVAELKPDTEGRAGELAMVEPTAAPGISRISVFLSPREVVFVLEGESPEESYRMWLDDPVRSTMLEPWLPLFDGPLHRAAEVSSWEIG